MRTLSIPVGLAALATLSACVAEDEPAIDSTEQPAFVSSTSIWWNPAIPVCWENPTAGNATERGWVEDAVNQTWERVSAVDLYGWGACAPSSGGLRILIADEGPRTLGLGRQLNGVQNGVLLNFTFAKWGTVCAGTRRESCIRVDAVHEIGHALGFAHEQNRSDTDRETCTDAPQGSDGDMFLGAFDAASIMSYCNPSLGARTWPWTLSDGDVQGAQTLYGGNPGALVGIGGKCLDVTGIGTANGTSIQTWECWGGPNQTWEVANLVPGWVNPVVGHVGKCLDVAGGSTANGAYVQLWDCLWNFNQNWVLGSVAFRGLAGKCLDVQGGMHDAGRDVWLWDCWPGNDAQLFSLTWNGTIRRTSDGMCLATSGFHNGAAVEMQPCNGRYEQTFTVADRGALIHNGSGKCVDVAGWGTANGTPLHLWDCHGGTNQRWAVKSELRGSGGKCLDVAGFSTANGARVQTWDCHGGPNQSWTYYP